MDLNNVMGYQFQRSVFDFSPIFTPRVIPTLVETTWELHPADEWY